MSKFRILSLSGGGYLGLFTAHILKEIESRHDAKVLDKANMVAGTSVGGLLAVAIANGSNVEELCTELKSKGQLIFPPRNPLRRLASVWNSSANDAQLRTIVTNFVGEDTRMGDLKKPTLVTSVDLTNGKIREFFGGGGTKTNDANIPVVDVIMATTAAPTYFPIHQVNHRLYADGGIVANAPDLYAIHRARSALGITFDEMTMLSIGTTKSPVGLEGIGNTRRAWGIAQWVWRRRIVNYLMQAQVALSRDLAKDLLGEDYFHLDAHPTHEQNKRIGLAIASEQAQQTLESLAEMCFEKAKDDFRMSSWMA